MNNGLFEEIKLFTNLDWMKSNYHHGFCYDMEVVKHLHSLYIFEILGLLHYKLKVKDNAVLHIIFSKLRRN